MNSRMHTPIESINYSYSGEARAVLTNIKRVAKIIIKNVGTTIDTNLIKITYFLDKSEITFHLASGTHMNVMCPARRISDAKRICARLEKEEVISKIHEKTSRPKSEKKHEHAFDVLKRNMAELDFAEHILVLPSALEQAKDCEFEYHGPHD
jgi:hypothetical protein